jgi:ribonuclease P protein component
VGWGQPGPAGSPVQAGSLSPVQAGFGAGSRHFKKAVDRNRIKRLCREAYRLQKQPLLDLLKKKERSLAIFFIYTGKELPGYHTVSDKIGVLLQKLMRDFE